MTFEVVAPESVGLSSQRLDRIQHVMSGYIDNRCFRGLTTMIWRNGSVAHLGKFGQKDDHSAIEFDTIFRIYSMTKPITSVAIMMLYEEGHFQLSDPVSKFIPDFSNMKVITDLAGGSYETVPAKGEMTIHDLLRHTSGLTYDFNGNVVSEMYKEGIELSKIAKNVVVKVPLTKDGIKTCKKLSKKKIGVNVTLCFSVNQAILAAKAGPK